MILHLFDLHLRVMSELIDTVDGDNAASLGNESLAEMERRHKAETRKLEGEIRALLKTAKKSTKAQIETQIIRMQYELKGRHAEEIEECEARGGTLFYCALISNIWHESRCLNRNIVLQVQKKQKLYLKTHLLKSKKMMRLRSRKLTKR